MNLRSILRTIALISVFTIFPVLLSGCGATTPDQNQFEHIEQVKRTGTLKSLGGLSIGEGTHLLEMSDNKTMRLKSLNVNLDSDKYLSKKVEVRGSISKTNDDQEIMDVQSIDLLEDVEEETDKGEESDYVNADLGFKLRYLDNWEIDVTDSKVTFTAPEPDSSDDEPTAADVATVERLNNPDKKTAEDFLNLPDDPTEIITLGYTRSRIGVDQLDGLKNDTDIYVARDTYMYHLSFKGDDVNNRIVFFNMVATFQFIGFVPEETESTDSTETASDDPESSDMTKAAETTSDPVTESTDEPDAVNNVFNTPSDPESDVPAIIVNDSLFTDTSDMASLGTAGTSYGSVAEYLGASINSLAPESSESGSWSASTFEFVDPNYVYVVYGDGSESRRILLTYEGFESSYDTELISYFEPGETTSWERVTGENPVESEEKTVYSLDNGEAQEETVVQEGYRYFESLPYHFEAQYPNSWYYSGNSGSGDIKHHYGFSNEPVENGNELVSIDVIGGTMPSGSSISLGSTSGVKTYSDDEVIIYVEGEDGNIYKVHGNTDNESYVTDIAATIKPN